MIFLKRVFLSHSSTDKKHYIEIVVEKLKKEIGIQRIVYDNLTFEEGMKNLEEIEKGLDKTDLFVIFLSDASLESDWVKKELDSAFDLYQSGKLKRIYPIIIDSSITHKDNRIPDWLKKEYNLKPINRPTVATRRILQRLREINWINNPRNKEKEKLFVGRNDLLAQFEERLDSFEKQTPICIIAAGLRNIGRRTLIKNSLIKSTIIDDSYSLPSITLDSHESLEDFIIKIYDLGFSSVRNLENLMFKSIDQKIDIALDLLIDIQNSKEVLMIVDDGGIVNPHREINDWFNKVVLKLQSTNQITLCIASSFRVRRAKLHKNDLFYIIDVPELDRKERGGLLKRYSTIEDLKLSRDDLDFFAGLLTGFPEQVFYTVELIKDEGISRARHNSHLIVDYNDDKVTYILEQYNEPVARDFMYLLSSFDFISYDMIFEIVEDNEFYNRLLEEFIAKAICENIGANSEYVRINDTIRNQLIRQRLFIPNHFQQKLDSHLKNFLMTYQEEDKDASDFFFSMKQALLLGEEINDKYIVPSHYLKTMKELYDKGKRDSDVVKLADKVLMNKNFMDDKIKHEIQYYLCSSLARLKKTRFLSEVQNIKGADHNFLMGFYYRLTGNDIKAIERLNQALEERPNFSRAKRELVVVYNNIEEFEKAYVLAKENYEQNKNNPYHIHGYFNCLSNNNSENIINETERKLILKELLTNLEKNESNIGNSMFYRLKSEYLAFVESDEVNSIHLINQAIEKYNDDIYPLFTKFSICERFNRLPDMEKVIEVLEKEIGKGSRFNKIFLKSKAILLAKKGDLTEALSIVSNLDYPENVLTKMKSKLERYAQQGIY